MTAARKTSLQLVSETLRALARKRAPAYYVPAAWQPVDRPSTFGEPRKVNPYVFFGEHVDAILAHPLPRTRAGNSARPGDWIRDAIIYNVFVRLTTAYDHARDGVLGTPDATSVDARTLNAQGIRESGTLLKTIALLGHVRALGANTLHLLPITAVGRFGNKGNLGSPYAIRNPYSLEPTLADPLLSLDVETQFRALVEACHRMGMRLIVEFVFRTASRDADWIPQHADWFYWIKREVEDRPPAAAPDDARYYGAPPFSARQLAEMNEKVERGDFSDLPPPPAWFRDVFTDPPLHVEREDDGRYVGTLRDGARVHVPSAFADWPPDDLQPPWTDVTYLRLYGDPPDGPSFNYIAYNTIRMYDSRLALPQNANRALWSSIRGILPHYQQQYGIDGCMVDMGHALPASLMQNIVEDARAGRDDFALLSENFAVGEDSARIGYNAVVGYEFTILDSASRMREFISRCCTEGLPIPAFGSGETHNTPRVAMRERGQAFCLAVWLVNCFLPDVVPFVHAGFELAETRPVNLGLGFLARELKELRGTTLGLFDLTDLCWDGAGDLPLQFGRVAALRKEYAGVAKARGTDAFEWLDQGKDDCIAYHRLDRVSGQSLVVVVEWKCRQPRRFRIRAPQGQTCFQDLMSGAIYEAKRGSIAGRLQPGQSLLLKPIAPAGPSSGTPRR